MSIIFLILIALWIPIDSLCLCTDIWPKTLFSHNLEQLQIYRGISI
uniref:Uncharacterized protein n=1 Tax=Rhizophora mucronata TaxID=61149 RepID=A0A2P2IJZ7_RHIMU